ncbi:Nif3-like dinuclear metal center hexameric protein [Aquibacillus koreensis]|uniref:GTP cyclohydrolase 1 type 2 homolog n=1 Tax=Aquibacillus koreensis TaxID=279446 RepID=A0A9X3WFW2_9BACI|nr:Nif3-like dinuclear metal center hexameric protein [Aquibacillus koreensis]MCT2537584.1 Nif3-like dinuclear metal center hexameric protein [Aquibacillus koreensis]MDC3419030.1 Nif3-like dinuclear metal center hexameric protein [Aquibacillus koreensis]
MNKTVLANDLIKAFEQWASKSLAYDWDNVGLQVGTLNKKTQKVMVTLDVLENVVDEAITKGVDLIIAHHPILFKPLKQINLDTASGRVIQKLMKHDITVYAAHTNLDIAKGGVSDILADYLGVEDTEVLVPSTQDDWFKLIVYVPESHAESFTEAIGDAGAGHIGNYSHCVFQTKGTGSFKPLDGTDPYIGTQGEIEKVDEIKVETIISQSQVAKFLPIVFEAHPYEEVAYDLIPLGNKGEPVGAGRIGVLPEPISLQSFCEHVKERLDVPTLRVTGDLTKKVKKIAILGGSGEDFIVNAKRMGADVYVTGDMTFHEAQDAWQMGLNVVDPGHYVEKVMKKAVKDFLEKEIKTMDASVEVIVSTSNTEPFQFI